MKQLHTIKLIGKGSYGTVYHMRDDKTQINYALKKIDLVNNKDNKGTITELQILRYHSCQYLLKYHYCYIEKNNLCIITDLYKKGDLLGIIKKTKKNNNYLTEKFIWKVFLDLCLGIYYLHENNIIHRDLKSANILIDDQNNACIADYGVSKIMGNKPITSTQIGTPFYMSPEIFNQNNYDKKIDMWSLGCILYEMIVLDNPFVRSKSMVTLCRKITSGKFPKIYSKRYSIELLKIIDYLLETSPYKRLSIENVLNLVSVKKKMKEYEYHDIIIDKKIPLIKKIPNNLNEWKTEIDIINLIKPEDCQYNKNITQLNILSCLRKNNNKEYNCYQQNNRLAKIKINKNINNKHKYMLSKNRDIYRKKIKKNNINTSFLPPIKNKLRSDLESINENISKCRKKINNLFITNSKYNQPPLENKEQINLKKY